ncbi:trypsin-like serine peptidase [Tabrizicola sp.]|uniref:trypsin-like serine peptidase n=1 Tax=Tabrizicola sp. TaxID=2005166 RepID=UPI003F4088D1
MRALVACLVLLAGAAAGQENSGLDELTTREDLRGWEPVGRVDIEGGGFCTGALIAADLVLTAGHCVVERDGAPIDAGRMTFRAGFSYGTSIAESAVERTIVDAEYRNVDPAPFDVIQRDVALLQLAEPIPSAVISPFVVASPGNGDEVSVVSYAAGREEALSWQRVCQVLQRQDGLLAVDCDVTFGSSGAPVLDRSGYRPRIVSIISAGGEYEGGTVAFGMELPAIVEKLKAALRRGEATSIATAEVEAEDPGSGMPGAPGKRIVIGGSNGSGAKFVKP